MYQEKEEIQRMVGLHENGKFKIIQEDYIVLIHSCM